MTVGFIGVIFVNLDYFGELTAFVRVFVGRFRLDFRLFVEGTALSLRCVFDLGLWRAVCIITPRDGNRIFYFIFQRGAFI